MREAVDRLWPEIQWIADTKLREQVTQTWMKALERSPLKPDDLNQQGERDLIQVVGLQGAAL